MLHDFAKVYLTTLSDKAQAIRPVALKAFLDQAPDEDRRMAIHLLNGYKSMVQVKRADLILWLMEYKNLPEWMIKECHTVTGDWAEAFGLIIGNASIRSSGLSLSQFVTKFGQPLPSKADLRQWVESMWAILSPEELLLFHKLILGSFRTIKEKNFLAAFLSSHFQIDFSLMTLRLSNEVKPWVSFRSLIHPDWTGEEQTAKPYAFKQPLILESELSELGPAGQWYAEPFIAGQRVQLIRRNRQVFVWAADQSLVTSVQPGLLKLFHSIPDGIVLDGILQDKKYGKDVEQQVPKPSKEEPARFFITDILEWEFMDLRTTPLLERKQFIAPISQDINHPDVLPVIPEELTEWTLLHPDSNSDGWVLKKKDSLYNPEQNTWWRFKSAQKQVYTLLMYTEALPGQNLVYLCTFGIYNDKQELVPVVKLSSDQLGEAQMTQLHFWIQNNVIQKFGPVRVVRPQQVFLVAFDKSVKNQRLKAGYTLKNAQIKKWETRPGAAHKIGQVESLKNLS